MNLYLKDGKRFVYLIKYWPGAIFVNIYKNVLKKKIFILLLLNVGN